MATVHLLIGIPGSGKSTYARELSKEKSIPIVSTDVVRKLHPDWEEQMIWPTVYQMCADCLKNQQDVIFDATNVTPKVRLRFINNVLACFEGAVINNLPFTIGAYYFDIEPTLCKKRVELRNLNPSELFLPPDVVTSYGDKIIPPTFDEPFIFIHHLVLENDQLVLKK